jgi:phosphatidylglycerol:prolipoprotein diacylglycerol transferase
MAPSIALGSVFGRIGCLLNGCCYGRECDLPWAIHFPPGHQTYPHGVHPTEVYDSLLNLVLYLALAWLYRRKTFDGEVFAAYLVGYAIFRSIVEIFRGDYPQYYLGVRATPAHLVSIGILLVGVVLWLVLPKTKKQPAARAGG